MALTERPVVSLLTFQSWNADQGAWQDLQQYATKVDVKRGGSQSGPSIAMGVGTLDATLYGALDLRDSFALRPNAPIRVVRKATAARRKWNLLGTTQASTAVSVLQYMDLTGTTTATTASMTSKWTQPYAAPTDMGMSAGRLYLTGTPYFASTNTRPDTFVPGEQYEITATAADNAESIWSSRMALVVYTGDPFDPTIVAQGQPRAVSSSQTAFPPLRFTVPLDQEWFVGVQAVDFKNAYSQPLGAIAQSTTFTKLAISTLSADRPEFTGTISDITQTIDYDKAANQKHIYTVLSAVDAIQSLANTDRSGVVSRSGAGYQDFASRVQQLASSALVPITAASSLDEVLYTWPGSGDGSWSGSGGSLVGVARTYVNGPGARFRFTRRVGSSAMSFAPTIQRTFTGLDTSVTYGFQMSVTLDESANFTPGDFVLRYVNGSRIQTSEPFTLAAVGDSVTVGLSFKPTSTKGYVQMISGATASQFAANGSPAAGITIRGMRLSRLADPRGYQLRDIALQSNLAAHLDLACNSVGGRWWVNKAGTVMVARRLLNAAPLVTISDEAAGDISYTDVSLSYDTKNVVNALNITNHGYDPSTGNAADDTSVIVSDSSIRRWGARAGDLDLSLYLGGANSGDLTRRAQEIMSRLSRPKVGISTFTINVQSNPAVLSELELHVPIQVRFEDLTQTCRVLAISHSIDPTRWLVTVTVTDVSSGATFGDFNAAKADGTTFSTFNAAHPGVSFSQFDADPLS